MKAPSAESSGASMNVQGPTACSRRLVLVGVIWGMPASLYTEEATSEPRLDPCPTTPTRPQAQVRALSSASDRTRATNITSSLAREARGATVPGWTKRATAGITRRPVGDASEPSGSRIPMSVLPLAVLAVLLGQDPSPGSAPRSATAEPDFARHLLAIPDR